MGSHEVRGPGSGPQRGGGLFHFPWFFQPAHPGPPCRPWSPGLAPLGLEYHPQPHIHSAPTFPPGSQAYVVSLSPSLTVCGNCKPNSIPRTLFCAFFSL